MCFISLVFIKYVLFSLFLVTGKIELYRLILLSIENIWENVLYLYDIDTNEYL